MNNLIEKYSHVIENADFKINAVEFYRKKLDKNYKLEKYIIYDSDDGGWGYSDNAQEVKERFVYESSFFDDTKRPYPKDVWKYSGFCHKKKLCPVYEESGGYSHCLLIFKLNRSKTKYCLIE